MIPADNVLFASEMVGAVRGIDPETGHYYDDTKRYVDGSRICDEDRQKIFEGNARRVYSRLQNKIARLAVTESSRRWHGRLPRLNGVIRALEQGKPAFVGFARADIETASALAAATLDGVVFEMEHAP